MEIQAATEQKNILGSKIRNRRETLGYSREKTARMAGISSQFLADIENPPKYQDTDLEARVTDLLSGLDEEEKEIGLDMMRIYVKALSHK